MELLSTLNIRIVCRHEYRVVNVYKSSYVCTMLTIKNRSYEKKPVRMSIFIDFFNSSKIKEDFVENIEN